MDTDDSSTAITAAPAGMSLSSWSELRRVSKTTTFRLLKLAGLELGKVRLPGINKPVSWLEQHQVDAIDQLAQQLAAGMSLARLESELSSALTTAAAPEPFRNDPTPSGPAPSVDALLTRLQAIESAIRSGAPLTTAEAAVLLGARPGAAITERGRLIARRLARNVWTLEAAG